MSPYEMLRFWKAVKITAWSGSVLTEAGIALKARARKEGDTRPRYVAGQHYVATLSGWMATATARILLPELAQIRGLRHRWCWERRIRPYVPVWDYAKVPHKKHSIEERARIVCVYMRPWTLYDLDETERNPLLRSSGKAKAPEEPHAISGAPRQGEDSATETGTADECRGCADPLPNDGTIMDTAREGAVERVGAPGEGEDTAIEAGTAGE